MAKGHDKVETHYVSSMPCRLVTPSLSHICSSPCLAIDTSFPKVSHKTWPKWAPLAMSSEIANDKALSQSVCLIKSLTTTGGILVEVASWCHSTSCFLCQKSPTCLPCGKFGIFQPPILKSKCWHSVGRSSCLSRMTFPYCPASSCFSCMAQLSLPAACMTAQLSKVTHLFALWKVWHLEPAREGRPASCTMISPFCSASSCFSCPAQLGKCDLCNARQYYCRMLTCM